MPTVAVARPRPPGARPVGDPRPLLGWAMGLWCAVAALALLSAAAETWRFVLLLRGRTVVLPAGVVSTSDVLVAAAGLFTPAVTVVAVVVTVSVLLRTSDWAAARAGRRPPRTKAGLLLRLLVPGWNVYGAGQVLVETHGLLLAPPAVPEPYDPVDRSDRARRGDRRLIVAWWAAWVVNAGLLVVTIARGWGGSLQAIADTVELHIAVDLAAAVTAGLGALVLGRFRRLAGGSPSVSSRWVVRPPVPTRGGSTAGSVPLTSATPVVGAVDAVDGAVPAGAADDDRDGAGRSATVSA